MPARHIKKRPDFSGRQVRFRGEETFERFQGKWIPVSRPKARSTIIRPRTTTPHPAHPIYPYLLKTMMIERPNQVWCADITFVPVSKGYLYLVAIMDWATRKVLAWRLSNTMHAEFCIEALNEAMARYGPPEIMNTPSH